MKKRFFYLSLAVLMGFTGCAVSPADSRTTAPEQSGELPDSISTAPEPRPKPPSEPLAMTVSDEPSVRRFLGFGAETDFYFTLNKNTERGVGPDDIALLTARMAEMKLVTGRVFFSYNWWEPAEGRRGGMTAEWKDFLNSLTMMKNAGTEVNICPWGDYFAYAAWQEVSYGQRSPQGEAIAKTADSLCSMLRHLIIDLGYTNVRYLTLVNEPDNQPENPYDHELYMELAVLVDRTLRDMGLRDNIYIVGADASAWGESVDRWFKKTFDSDTERIFDGYASHTYAYKLPDMAKVGKWIKNRVDLLDKIRKHTDMIVGEFGMYGEENGTYWQPKSLTYEYGLFIGAFSLAAVNNGAAQILNWNLTDTYVTLDNSQMSSGDENFRTGYGLWQYKDFNWAAKPGFYSFSMLSSKTAAGDAVYPVTSENKDVFGSVFVSPSGELTLAVVNISDKAFLVTADVGDKFSGKTLKYYGFEENHLPADSKLIPSSDTAIVTGGQIGLYVPKYGMAVVSERQ